MSIIDTDQQECVHVVTWPDGTPVTASDDSWAVAYAWGHDPVAVDHDRENVFIWE